MKEKILIPYIALSFSHGDSEMERTLLALDKSFGVIKKAISGEVDNYLDSELVKPVFRKYN
jgi:glutamate-1-semialdehyde 2,1-aminomutase